MITCRCILNTIEVNGRCYICKLPKLMRVIEPEGDTWQEEPSSKQDTPVSVWPKGYRW